MAESDIYIFFSNSFSPFEDRFPSKQIYFHICKFLKWYFENGMAKNISSDIAFVESERVRKKCM